MVFNPDSITPPEDLLLTWEEAPLNSLRDDYIVAARWGAAQAVDALKHQWPEPISDRPPTKEDGNGDGGWVQYFERETWFLAHWESVALNKLPWLHTKNWRPRPEPTLKEQALEILLGQHQITEITYQQVQTIRAALALIPDEPGG
jgi:hypothetical protein